MSTENTQIAATGSSGAESSSSNVASTQTSSTISADTGAPQGSSLSSGSSGSTPSSTGTPAQAGLAPGTPVIGADGQVTYTPNFKYRAALQEKELDPFFHPLIKDPDSEKKVKDVFTRADAFDYMKEKFEKRNSEYDSVAKDFQMQSSLVNKVRQAQQKKDYDSVFRNIGLPEHEIISWAAKKVDYLQMMQGLPPEQKQALEQQQQQAIQNEYYQEQLNHMQTQYQAQATQAREMQLDTVLSRPEVSTNASFWDSKMGYIGAFRDTVVEEAKNYWLATKQDLSPEQAVSMVLKKFGAFINHQGNSPQMNAPQTSAQPGMQMPGQKPVIPAINGTSKTPIKKQIKSIEDIKKRAKELQAQG